MWGLAGPGRPAARHLAAAAAAGLALPVAASRKAPSERRRRQNAAGASSTAAAAPPIGGAAVRCEQRRWFWSSRSTPEAFAVRKARALRDRDAGVASIQPLTEKEAKLEELVLKPAVAAAVIDPKKNFLEHKNDYDISALLGILQAMPKGGHLHTHGLATGNFSSLVDRLQKDGHFYVWQGDAPSMPEGTIRCFGAGPPPGVGGWVLAGQVPREKLYGYLTQTPGTSAPDVAWKEFGGLWERVLPGTAVAPFYFGREGFLWEILEQQLSSGVIYLEIKEVFGPWTEYDGAELSDEEFLSRFKSTVQEFRAAHPEFLGARVVLTAIKFQSVDSVREDFRRAVALKEKFPDFVAGFDLAGFEDLLTPIEEYAVMLEEEKAIAKKRHVDLPLLLHAGESNLPKGTQIYDAVLLGCERIGHGFALARHPSLIQLVKASKICLECCPISNQAVGYFSDIAAHSALHLLRAGVPMTISADDAGMWHYGDVSYDFAAVTKAWDLSLAELKVLTRNSLVHSTLRGPQQTAAVKAWESQWDRWVQEELGKAGRATAVTLDK